MPQMHCKIKNLTKIFIKSHDEKTSNNHDKPPFRMMGGTENSLGKNFQMIPYVQFYTKVLKHFMGSFII
jgi:hypothetical protein